MPKSQNRKHSDFFQIAIRSRDLKLQIALQNRSQIASKPLENERKKSLAISNRSDSKSLPGLDLKSLAILASKPNGSPATEIYVCVPFSFLKTDRRTQQAA